jgi:hypothetical protein
MDVVLVTGLAVGVLGPLITLIHELGHALAALALGRSVSEFVVGHHEDVTVTIGRTVLRFGRSSDDQPAGFVRLDPGSSPDEVLAIALLGPLANLITAPLFAAAARSDGTSGWFETVLWLAAFGSIIVGLWNLIPSRGRGGGLSDGAIIQLAWAVHRGRLLPEFPERTSPEAKSEPEPETHWIVLAVLGLVFIVAMAASAYEAAGAMLLVFGVAFLIGGHRTKAF